FVLLDNLKHHFPLTALAGFSDQRFHKPRASALRAPPAENAHGGETAGPTASSQQGDAAWFPIHKQDSAGEQVDAVLAQQVQKCDIVKLDGDKVSLESLI